MNILHFSTHDTEGGAAKAAYRLHTALLEAGHSSTMVVGHKQSSDQDVQQVPVHLWRSRLGRVRRHIPLIGGPKATYMFNFDTETFLDARVLYGHQAGAPDVICLHWITGFLTVRAIRRLHDHYQCPFVWMLVDQEPLTGGCHYAFGCDGFKRQCGRCPQLSTNRLRDRSRAIWKRKHRHLSRLPIALVAPTSWIAAQAEQSSLFRDRPVEVIPLAIDTSVFRPVDQGVARDLLHVPQDKSVVFFGASSLDDPRKGMGYLAEALDELPSIIDAEHGVLRKEDVFLLVAGHKDRELLEALPFPTKYLGYLQDDVTLALAYQAADVFVCPSVEDAGPMMIPESMLCGTPVVAFNTGGAPDLIETMGTGYLAEYKDSADLANGIHMLLARCNLAAMRKASHDVAVEKHSPPSVAERHAELYESLLSREKVRSGRIRDTINGR